MVGIVFSVVLVMVQMGLYLGFGDMVTRMIDHADADLWVMRDGTKCFEDPSLIDARKQGAYQAIDGVASAEPLVIGFSDWHMANGAIPPVFIDMSRARSFVGFLLFFANYFLVKLKPGADAKQVESAIKAQSPKYEVMTTAEFRERSRTFWLFGTGAGAALFAGAILGVIVGTVIVAQTLYSSTKDHIDEFATLRAMGSSNRYIYTVIMYQALLNAIVGFCFAAAIGMIVVLFTRSGALHVVITPSLMGAIFLLTVVMCIASAFTKILKVVRIDPEKKNS